MYIEEKISDSILLSIPGNWWWPLSNRKHMAGDRTWWSGFQKPHLSCTNEFTLCLTRQLVDNKCTQSFPWRTSTLLPSPVTVPKSPGVSVAKEVLCQLLGSSVGGKGRRRAPSVQSSPPAALLSPCCHPSCPAGNPSLPTNLLWQQTWANYMCEVHFNHKPCSHRDITCDASSQ